MSRRGRQKKWGGLTTKMANMIMARGREYTPHPLPNDINRGPTGKCFDWSALETARLRPKYRYVEGIATDPDKPGEEKWILHAWLTDGYFAFDPTWGAFSKDWSKERAVPSRYIGIEMDIYKVNSFMGKTGYQCVLANGWRAPEIYEDILNG